MRTAGNTVHEIVPLRDHHPVSGMSGSTTCSNGPYQRLEATSQPPKSQTDSLAMSGTTSSIQLSRKLLAATTDHRKPPRSDQIHMSDKP